MKLVSQKVNKKFLMTLEQNVVKTASQAASPSATTTPKTFS